MDKELSAYQYWQLERYGNYLPEIEPEDDDEEEIEDNQDIELVIDLD